MGFGFVCFLKQRKKVTYTRTHCMWPSWARHCFHDKRALLVTETFQGAPKHGGNCFVKYIVSCLCELYMN